MGNTYLVLAVICVILAFILKDMTVWLIAAAISLSSAFMFFHYDGWPWGLDRYFKRGNGGANK